MTTLDSVLASANNDEVVIDFTEAADFELIPDGEYVAVIEEVQAGVAKSGGPKIVWKFVIQDAAAKDRVLFRHTPTTGKGAGLAKQVMKAIGLDADSPKVQFKMSSAKGKRVVLVVGKQKDNPDFNEIKRVKPAPSGVGSLGL